MKTTRRHTRQILIGSVAVGGSAPVSVQSMTNTPTHDAPETLAQIRELALEGCDIVRVAVPDSAAAEGLRIIVSQSPIPVIADIHFDARLAHAALAAGAHGIRVNPGNFGDRQAVQKLARAAAAAGIAVRVGVNGGSLPRDILARHKGVCAAALVDAALRYCSWFEAEGCTSLKVSLKASSVPVTVAACRQFAGRSDIPLHIGVTEAGTPASGIVKSAVGIGALLLDGIGDTLRVSLTAPPVEEVRTGIRILEAVGLRDARPEIVACPTCGRTGIDLLPLVERVEADIRRLKRDGFVIQLDKIALMGCVVNGPGEARDADLGIAGGSGKGVLFRHGEIVRTVPEAELADALLQEVRASAVKR
jgi:(E)-4-hydroxy-3-methylbut-2-enyl-diphosphate synthase